LITEMYMGGGVIEDVFEDGMKLMLSGTSKSSPSKQLCMLHHSSESHCLQTTV